MPSSAEFWETAPVFPDREQLQRLVSVVGKRTGAMVEPLFELLVQLSWRIDDPWVVLEGMLNVRDSALMLRALQQTQKLAETGKLLVDLEVLNFFAERVEREGSPINDAEQLKILGRIIQLAALPLPDSQQDPIVWLYLSSSEFHLRQFAARILDAEAKPVSTELARTVLGEDAVEVLAPYLAFTRATHLDLLYLIPVPGQASAMSQRRQGSGSALRQPTAAGSDLGTRLGAPQFRPGCRQRRHHFHRRLFSADRLARRSIAFRGDRRSPHHRRAFPVRRPRGAPGREPEDYRRG